MIGRLERSLSREGVFENLLGRAVRVGIESEHLAQVGPAGGHELEPIGLRPGHGFLVRINIAFTKALQADSGHESAARETLAAEIEMLVIGVQGRLRVGEQHALFLPLF